MLQNRHLPKIFFYEIFLWNIYYYSKKYHKYYHKYITKYSDKICIIVIIIFSKQCTFINSILHVNCSLISLIRKGHGMMFSIPECSKCRHASCWAVWLKLKRNISNYHAILAASGTESNSIIEAFIQSHTSHVWENMTFNKQLYLVLMAD